MGSFTVGQYLNTSDSTSCCMCNAPRNAPRSTSRNTAESSQSTQPSQPTQSTQPAASDELLSSDDFADFPEATDRLAAQPAAPRQPPQIMRVGNAMDGELDSESSLSDSEPAGTPTASLHTKDETTLAKHAEAAVETKTAAMKKEETENQSAVRAIPMKLRPIVPAPKANIQIKNMKKDAHATVVVKTKPVKIQVKSKNTTGKDDLFAELNMGAQLYCSVYLTT